MNKWIVLAFLFAANQVITSDNEDPTASPPLIQETEVEYSVVLDPIQRTRIFPEILTKVLKISKKLGEHFEKGDVLILLDDKVLKENYEKAFVKLQREKTNLSAKKELYQEKIASLLDLKDAEASKAEAEAELALAKKSLKASVIRAPYSGKVVDLFIEEHEIPLANKEILEIVNDSTLIAKLLLPSSFVREIYIGMPLQIKILETDEIVSGKVVRIGSVIDAASSTLKVEAEIDNKEGGLKAGMSGTTRFFPNKRIEGSDPNG